MLTRKSVIALMLFVLSINTWSQKFVASADIKLNLPNEAIIAQSGESTLFKFPNWVLSHEILNPKTIYPNVNLTGYLSVYVRNIFDPKNDELPKWLQTMAQEQANVFKVTDGMSKQFRLGGVEVYSVYDSSEKNGHVFLVGKDYVSHFNVPSDKAAINLIRKYDVG